MEYFPRAPVIYGMYGVVKRHVDLLSRDLSRCTFEKRVSSSGISVVSIASRSAIRALSTESCFALFLRFAAINFIRWFLTVSSVLARRRRDIRHGYRLPVSSVRRFLLHRYVLRGFARPRIHLAISVLTSNAFIFLIQMQISVLELILAYPKQLFRFSGSRSRKVLLCGWFTDWYCE